MNPQEAFNLIKQQIQIDIASIKDMNEALHIVQKLVDKATPEKPIPEGQDNMDYILCPACHNPVGVVDDVYGENSLKKYCHKCGQALDWSKKVGELKE